MAASFLILVLPLHLLFHPLCSLNMSGSVSKPDTEPNTESMSGPVPASEPGPIPSSTSGLTDDSMDKHCVEFKRRLLYHYTKSCSTSFPAPDSEIVCTTCAQLSYEQLCTPEGQSYHESWASLVENAAQGCYLCTFFMSVEGTILETAGPLGRLYLRIEKTNLYLFGSDDKEVWLFRLCLPADIDEPLPKLAQNVEEVIHYADRTCKKAICKILKWINGCETAHPHCRKPGISSLPSRVLNISHMSSSQTISLVEGKGLREEYVTLSYCWGKEAENANGQISTCTSQNINQLFQGISVNVLPPLYKDAVMMTQKLGKRYLWIDSLCIIQDSNDDWSKECPRMADIYANSFLTISAASCRNKQEGFIKATMFEMDAKLTTLPGTQGQYIHVRPSVRLIPPTPLTDRAWVFQERLLSSRVLHLTSLDMVFQCDKHQPGSHVDSSTSHLCGQKSFFWNTSSMSFEGLDPEDNKTTWYRVVEIYAHLKLTYETDRLPALSSIAHLVQQRFLLQDGLRANYVAGLWEHDLAYGLLWWIRDHGKSEAKELSPYVAPTWSWASIQRKGLRIRFSTRHDLLKLRVVDVQAHHSTSNPFGEISSAYLTVDAPLQRVPTENMQIIEVYRHVMGFGILVKGFASIIFSFDNGSRDISASGVPWLLPCVSEAAVEVFELRKDSELDWFFLDRWDGLALELVDEKRQVYKRIGVFAFVRLFGEKRNWDDLGFVDKRVTII